MNLHPAKKHESVSIVLVPFDQYSSFPGAVDALLKHTRAPFELIIVEGGAPSSIRHPLERKKKDNKHIKIIYSNHRPRMAEAFNLGLPHVRTERAFFMHNNVRVTPHWMENLLAYAKERPGILCPHIAPLHADRSRFFELDYPVNYTENQDRTKNHPDVDMHAFLVDKEVLNKVGEFDEKVGTSLVGVDMSHHLKQMGIGVHRDPFTVLEYESPSSYKSFDLSMFHTQWDEHHTRMSIHHLNQKWGIRLHEAKYIEWLQNKRQSLRKRRASGAAFTSQDPFLGLDFPKLDLKKLLQVLTKA